MNKTAIAALTLAILLPGCGKKETTAVEAPPAGEAQPTAQTNDAPSELPPNLPPIGEGRDASLLPSLSPDDKADFEAWFKKHNIGTDPVALEQDPDADGYSNREEFLAGTNPRDPQSLPGVVEGLSVKVVNEVKVPMLLREVKPGSARIERTDGGEPEEVKQGGQIRGTPYRVTEIKREVRADKHGVPTDFSHVILTDPASNETITLVKDLPARSSESHAIVVDGQGQEKKVRLDDTLTLPGQGAKQFKVLELRNDQIVVEEIGTRRALTIPKR